MAFIYIFFFFLKKFEKVEKTDFFRANPQISNLNVLHKGLLLPGLGFEELQCAAD